MKGLKAENLNLQKDSLHYKILIYGTVAVFTLALVIYIYFSGNIPEAIKHLILGLSASVFIASTLAAVFQSIRHRTFKTDAPIHLVVLWVTLLYVAFLYASLVRQPL